MKRGTENVRGIYAINSGMLYLFVYQLHMLIPKSKFVRYSSYVRGAVGCMDHTTVLVAKCSC